MFAHMRTREVLGGRREKEYSLRNLFRKQ